MSASTKFLAKLAATKRCVKREAIYEVNGGWKHSRSVSVTFSSREDAETDFRFCCNFDRCNFTD